jgi:hypothetical protein
MTSNSGRARMTLLTPPPPPIRRRLPPTTSIIPITINITPTSPTWPPRRRPPLKNPKRPNGERSAILTSRRSRCPLTRCSFATRRPRSRCEIRAPTLARCRRSWRRRGTRWTRRARAPTRSGRRWPRRSI